MQHDMEGNPEQLEMFCLPPPVPPMRAEPEAVTRAMADAPSESPASQEAIKITREAINLLPIRSYEGPIRLIDSEEGLRAACAELKSDRILGFDTETKPVFRKGVSHPPSLVQLAGSRSVCVFQLNKLRDFDGLREILSDAHRTKAGVAIADDLRKLAEIHPFKPGGFKEIGNLAREAGLHQTGLRPLAAMLLGFRISKREQRSNWARKTLTASQLRYAATDAWVSRELYLRLTEQLSKAPRRAGRSREGG